jgi:hypothetical protein
MHSLVAIPTFDRFCVYCRRSGSNPVLKLLPVGRSLSNYVDFRGRSSGLLCRREFWPELVIQVPHTKERRKQKTETQRRRSVLRIVFGDFVSAKEGADEPAYNED